MIDQAEQAQASKGEKEDDIPMSRSGSPTNKEGARPLERRSKREKEGGGAASTSMVRLSIVHYIANEMNTPIALAMMYCKIAYLTFLGGGGGKKYLHALTS